VTLAALASVLPIELIMEAIQACGRQAKRVRKLPPEVVTWLVVGMGLYRGKSASNVLRRVMEGLGDVLSWGLAELPHSTSITHARDRLGWETVRLIFRKLAEHLSAKHAAASVWLGLRVLVLDGTTFMTADTPANDAAFGRPGTSRGGAPSAYPRMRGIVLMGAWCHLIAEVVLGPYRGTSELKMAQQYLLPRLKSGTVILMDRLYYAFAWLTGLDDKDVYFVVRMKKGKRCLKARKRKKLAPGDWLGVLPCPGNLRNDPRVPEQFEVRIVTYKRKGFRAITVVTNLLDPELYPAREIGKLYLDRWEAEVGYRELKIHMGENRVLFRSQRPDRVLQEAYGLLIAYNCVRALMAEAAAEAGIEPRQLSFVDCLDRIRLAVMDLARAEPEQLPALRAKLITDLARCRIQPKKEGRRYDRAVKIKQSNYARKRPGQKAATSRRRQRRVG
jgi:hypothetical protein